MPRRRGVPDASAPAGRHRRLEPQDGGDRRGGAVQRPVEPAERDERRADGALRVDDELAEVEAARRRAAAASDQNTTTLAAVTSSRLQQRPLAQARGVVLKLVQPRAPGDEAFDGPADQPEQPQLFARRRIDGEAVGVVGVALGAAHFVGVAIAPDRALAQQPVRRQPRAARARAAPTTRSANEHDAAARPPIIPTSPPAMKSIEIDSGGPVMPEIEVARDGDLVLAARNAGARSDSTRDSAALTLVRRRTSRRDPAKTSRLRTIFAARSASR